MNPEGPALPVRSDLRSVPPYVSPQHPARYRMNTNESPYAPPRALVREVAAEVEAIALNRYPDRDASSLFGAIAEHVDWPREGLWVANGSNEVFLHLFLAFGGHGRKALVFEPTYSLHSLIPKVASTEVLTGERDADFAVDPDEALALVQRERPEVIILCSPNNPTGGCESPELVQQILAAAPGIVVVDEAYIEFAAPEKSVRPMLADNPNLVITKTFSKAWRLAGVRIGYMLAAPEMVAELARVRLPYHLSAITQVVGEAAMRHAHETLELVKAIGEERDRLSLGLKRLGIKTFHSDANFVLFEIDDPERVHKELLEMGVLIRSYAGTPRLEDCLRVTAGLPDETDAFLRALEAVMS